MDLSNQNCFNEILMLDLFKYLDQVGHGEVHDVVFPSQLKDDVWVK